MSFGNPHVLWLLAVLPPALIAFFWWSGWKRRQLMARFIESRLLPGLTVGISPARQKFRQGLFIAAVVCMLLALARPQWGFHWEEARIRGLDIVVAIDTSKSMLAEDISPNRLARAKLAALDLMQLARSDRLGLVTFAGTAFLQCPLTVDDQAFRQSVDAVEVGNIPQGGTAIAEAVEAALTAYKEGENHRILVMFTDGEDHDSKPVEAARKAAEAGLRIYTVGIGSVEGEPLRARTADGRLEPIRDEKGQPVTSHLNEELLRDIAGATPGGFYLHLRGARTMDILYEQGLSKLPKADRQERFVKQYYERYHWPLALALVLLIAEILMPERSRPRRERSPGEPVGGRAVRSGPAKAAAMILFLLVLSASSAPASPQGALRDYNAGRYDRSLQEYEKALKEKKDDPRLQYNAGVAAYRAGEFDKALQHLNDAINSPDVDLLQRSYYNRGNTQYHLGEKAPDPSKQKENWNKALQDYQSALKLQPQDNDAKHNYDFVKQRLEELKQQQQQSNDKNQDQQDQQQQQQEQQQNGEQQKQQQQQRQAQQQQQEQQSAEQKEQEKQAQQAAQEQEKKPEEQQGSQSGQSEEQPAEEKKEAESPEKPGEMSAQQARQILDSQREQEKVLPPTPTGDPRRPLRDW